MRLSKSASRSVGKPKKRAIRAPSITLLKHLLQQCTKSIKRVTENLSLPWISAILAPVFPILTAIYAFHPQAVSRLEAVGGSPSSALLVLRVLSETGGVMLVATIAAAFSTLQSILVARKSRPGGLRFLDYLVLQEGAGFSSLICIFASRGRIRIVTRIWSVLRLIAIILVPILNVVVMSNVDTRSAFYRVETVPIYGFGIGNFNASLARLWAPATDLLHSSAFNEFASDRTRTIDITEPSEQKNCNIRDNSEIESGCSTLLFVPGGIENSVEQLLEANKSTDADAYLAIDQQGYMFKFEQIAPRLEYNVNTECNAYGSELFAFALCLKNGADGMIQAHITLCSIESHFGNCFNTTSWRNDDGWSTSLQTSHRRATVAYGRFNGKILSHTFSDMPTVDAFINATELLQAFNTILGADSSNSTLISPFAVFGSRLPALPYYIWWYIYGISALPRDDAGGNARSVAGLQSLLALTIYHCQAKDFADLQRGLGFNNSTEIGREILALFPVTELDTAILPAIRRYNITVGRRSLIAYIVITGVTWLFCAAVLMAGSINPRTGKGTDNKEFPTLDFCTNCDVKTEEDETEISKDQFLGLGALSTKERMVVVAQMRVKPAQV